ncbi:MAG: glycoside hydrolase family 88 protein [Prolixibacteraceae bacterium]|nr:glycoside hydrolase family 88 protein [Prolixibacteraceae bacterium]
MKFLALLPLLCFLGCSYSVKNNLDAQQQLGVCSEIVLSAVDDLEVNEGFPRAVKEGDYAWTCTGHTAWTSGFFPGLLWYLYEHSHNDFLKLKAEAYTENLKPLKELAWGTHDLGFMMFCSAGNAYRITGDEKYKSWLLETADSLADLFNPDVGTIHSWPWMKNKRGWPHNTIIDNMMNLELLFWASKNGGSQRLYDIAVSHAQSTLKNQFRDDFSTCHVVVYDNQSPKVLSRITDQGFADESVWSRGQSWAIYGFAMCYRETGLPEFKEAAVNAADYYLSGLPEDHVPYWDFKLPDFKEEEKDASAAAIAASGMLELAKLSDNPDEKKRFKEAAVKTLNSLSSEEYLSGETMAILDHSVGSKPHGNEIDVPLVYADYYYVEALMRLKKWF